MKGSEFYRSPWWRWGWCVVALGFGIYDLTIDNTTAQVCAAVMFALFGWNLSGSLQAEPWHRLSDDWRDLYYRAKRERW